MRTPRSFGGADASRVPPVRRVAHGSASKLVTYATLGEVDIALVDLEGQLTAGTLQAALRPVDDRLERDDAQIGLVVDARAMTGYEGAARELFIEWNKKNRPRIARVAIVTDRISWRMVIAAMSLASGQAMRAFAELTRARRWADSGS
jgi:hypothetical protein